MGEDIEILNSVLDRQTVVWLWCKSLNALEKLENLIQCNALMNLFTGLTIFPISAVSAISVQHCTVSLDSNQFRKEVDLFPTVTTFTAKLDVDKNEKVIGVTKLKNRIYAVYMSDCCNLLVFEDQTPFQLLLEMKLNEISRPEDLASYNREDCLYVIDSHEQCVWKISRDRHGNRLITDKWMPSVGEPYTVSVNNDGQLLMVKQGHPLSSLEMHDCDSQLLLAFYLHKDIQMPCHAVETPNGNFNILHDQLEDNFRSEKVVSEVTRDGQMVIRKFVQKLTNPRYLSLDYDGKVFVADEGFMSGKVILMQPGLNQNLMICPTGDNSDNINEPSRLCYDDETRQLIVGAEEFVNIYSINRY